jgi:hypothetical protein
MICGSGISGGCARIKPQNLVCCEAISPGLNRTRPSLPQLFITRLHFLAAKKPQVFIRYLLVFTRASSPPKAVNRLRRHRCKEQAAKSWKNGLHKKDSRGSRFRAIDRAAQNMRKQRDFRLPVSGFCPAASSRKNLISLFDLIGTRQKELWGTWTSDS